MVCTSRSNKSIVYSHKNMHKAAPCPMRAQHDQSIKNYTKKKNETFSVQGYITIFCLSRNDCVSFMSLATNKLN